MNDSRKIWLSPDIWLEDLKEFFTQGKYNLLPYNTWREIEKFSKNFANSHDSSSKYIKLTLDHEKCFIEFYNDSFAINNDMCFNCYSFPKDDNSLGSYLNHKYFNVLGGTISLENNITTGSIALTKINDADTAKISTNIDTLTIKGDISSGGITFSTLEDRIKELETKLNSTIKNEDKDNMNNFGINFDFGKVNSDQIHLSAYGIAVKNKAGTWVSYDTKNERIMNVEVLNIPGDNFLYKMPVALNQVAAGDLIIHSRKPMFVIDFTEDHKAFIVIDIIEGEEKTILPAVSPFNFNFVTKVVSIMDFNGANAPSDSNPFGNMLPFLMMSDSDKIDPMALMLCSGGNFNPMMLLALGDNKDIDLTKMLLLSQMSGKSLFPQV